MKKAILEARQEVSKQEILNVAKRLFAEQGVRATSLARLAEELGVTKAALYYYYSSKQEIVVETVRANVRDFGEDVLDPLPDDLSPAEMLARSMDLKVARAERDGPLDLRFFYTVLLEELGEPEVEAVFRDFLAGGRKRLFDLISDGQRRGQFRDDVDIETVLNVLSATIMGIDILWLNEPATLDMRAAYRLAIDQTLTTLSGSPA